MSGSNSPSVMARKREELYGASRLKNVEALRSNLTTDHIAMISEEGMKSELPSWQSTSKINFKGTQPLRPKEQISSTDKQDNSHFDFKADNAPIDDVIYQSSLTSNDYQHKKTKPLPPVKPDGNVNLPDMNPRYWRDSSMAPSLYATDFSDNKEVRHGVEVPEVVKERNEMRRRNVEDVRSTHFRLGNDPSSFSTETGLCYNSKKPLPAVGGKNKTSADDMTTADLSQKMIEQDSAIFRKGDYNVTRPKPDSTTFSRDYNATEKPYKSAAFVEPTRTQKGRFLIDSTLKNAVETEASRYPGPPSVETKSVDPIASSSALKQLFLQYDAKRSGYVSKPILRRVCDCLLQPISPVDLEEILRHTMRGKEGAIDYQSFVDQFVDLQMKKQPKHATDVNANEVPCANSGGGREETNQQASPFIQQADTTFDTAMLGKEYQTSVHFKFGNDADKLSSIYNKDFQQSMQEQQQQTSRTKLAPQHSEVMHKLPGVEFGSSTKQSDFINFKEVSPAVFNNATAARDQASLKNKRRHEVNSVVLAGDKEKEATDRQKSLSHSSYVPHQNSDQFATSSAPLPKYNYLTGDGALPYPANVPRHSETNEAFASVKTHSTESNGELQAFKSENKDRSKDGKRAHFQMGNDDPNSVSEAMESFQLHEKRQIAAAGKKNQEDPRFKHHQVSKNTQDLSRDPMAPSNFQAQRMVKKSYYNAVPNPGDPLHIKLRSRLMDHDSDNTGRLVKRTVKHVCQEFQIAVSQYAMDNLLQRCESDFGDETVDYHKFVRSLTLEQIPNEVSAAHSSSIMMKDYRPLDQRSFTNAQLLTMKHMEDKPLEPMPTHFFHVDASGENTFQSLTTKDYVKPELHA
ncbi:uncharacterized protein [Apostichopus japonicus]|uniref:uncharacterized protein isoform X3 n=1 Tax=Stichopus japonicus TaxID=307972 RepID=UPI003AB693E1